MEGKKTNTLGLSSKQKFSSNREVRAKAIEFLK